jgi:antitoxin (DNA-binding transcriptional repressor) of toxin-antitoxin stability system
MAVLYISEAEAIRDFAALLARVRTGTEIVIEGEAGSILATLTPPQMDIEEPEPGYDDWFRAEVERTLQNDPARRISEEDAETLMAEHRRAVLLRLQDSAA